MKMMKKILAAGMAMLMVCSLFAVAAPTTTASALAGAYKKGEGKIYAWGCDMSSWNVGGSNINYKLVDFNKMKADGCEFVILRIGDEKAKHNGVRQADPTFVTLYNMARAAGMHVGAYYYSYKTTTSGVIGDAKWCLDIIEKNNMYFEYPIYFDIEADIHWKLSASTQVSLCNAWCETMIDAGYFPGVYSNIGCAMTNLQNSSNFNYDTWVPKPLRNSDSGPQFKPAESTVVDVDGLGKIDFSVTYGMWQYKWYSDSWSEPSYEGSYWYESSVGWPLDCNVAFRDYPTIMETYGYNNVVVKHTISFESNGGSSVADVKVVNGQKLTKPSNPTKYGFDFAGWYCNPELTDPYDFNTPVPYDFTLYAKWTEANWATNNNLMPNESQLVLNDFDGRGAIWPFWNNDATGSVTLYNGAGSEGEWTWPSAYMAYENSFDAVNNGYLYVKKDGTAQFNVVLTYLDKNAEAHELHLSDVAKIDGTDFPAGYLEEFYDVGSYIRNLGHAPASGNVKFTKVTYYVIGELDSYVKLYDLKFTQKFDVAGSYHSLYNKDAQQIGGTGSFTYDDGVLTMAADSDAGYSVKFTPNADFSPADLTKLLMDVNATAPFNVTIELTNANGDATIELRNEFFNVFDLQTAPTALPAGNHNVEMYFAGYYEWNGGIPASSTIKSVTVSLAGEGTLTLKALQVSRSASVTYVNDGEYNSGSLTGETVDLGDVNGDGEVSTMDARLLISFLTGSETLSDAQKAAADFDGSGTLSTADVREMLFAVLA